jgi:hypothetical protein
MGLLLFFAQGPAQIREDEKLVRCLLTIGNEHGPECRSSMGLI